ncbi:MAG: sugar phosphate nucleotidyltransferase, partial [Bacteroidia bacterium]|nr:sugar phosphate nucleotidyltransferase [Bacteroidia bacterium]
MIEQTYALILAGGSGTRFWPLSRAACPKQFLDVLGIGRTLLQATFERLSQVLSPHRIWLSGAQQHSALIQDQLPSLSPSQCLLEPLQRNTAVSILWAVEVLYRQASEALLWIVPSDHFIPDEEEFIALMRQVLQGCDFSEAIFTIGIRPRYPHTGYGYIQFIPKPSLCKPVKTFTEKPSRELAEVFIQSGEFLWNSGMFLARVEVLRQAFIRHASELYELFAEVDVFDPEAVRHAFQQAPSISFDYAIMEKYAPVMVVEGTFRWWDLGGWNAVYEVSPHDSDDNSTFTNNRLKAVKGSFIFSSTPQKLIIAEGLTDYFVIDTPDVLLIMPRSQEQSIREWVQRLRTEGEAK